jgi:hypothetical protein
MSVRASLNRQNLEQALIAGNAAGHDQQLQLTLVMFGTTLRSA